MTDPADDGSEDRQAEARYALDFTRRLREQLILNVKNRMGPRFADRPRIPEVDEWIENGRGNDWPNLILMGPTGTGKSTQAWQALQGTVEIDPEPWKSERPKWVADLFAEMCSNMRPSDSSEYLVERYKTAAVLFIDDLTPLSSEWQGQQLSRVVDARWMAELPTIVTTNYNREQLSAGLPDVVVSRLFHGAKIVIIRGSDRRVTE